jgi:hypothetical protein
MMTVRIPQKIVCALMFRKNVHDTKTCPKHKFHSALVPVNTALFMFFDTTDKSKLSASELYRPSDRRLV